MCVLTVSSKVSERCLSLQPPANTDDVFARYRTSSQMCEICHIHPVPLLFPFCSLSLFNFLTSAPPKPLQILSVSTEPPMPCLAKALMDLREVFPSQRSAQMDAVLWQGCNMYTGKVCWKAVLSPAELGALGHALSQTCLSLFV